MARSNRRRDAEILQQLAQKEEINLDDAFELPATDDTELIAKNSGSMIVRIINIRSISPQGLIDALPGILDLEGLMQGTMVERDQMIEGIQPFYPKPPEEAVKLMCLEGKRPSFKVKSKNCPQDLTELIEECWDLETLVRPTFSEIIVRLDKICAHYSKQGWWKDTFKFPWK